MPENTASNPAYNNQSEGLKVKNEGFNTAIYFDTLGIPTAGVGVALATPDTTAISRRFVPHKKNMENIASAVGGEDTQKYRAIEADVARAIEVLNRTPKPTYTGRKTIGAFLSTPTGAGLQAEFGPIQFRNSTFESDNMQRFSDAQATAFSKEAMKNNEDQLSALLTRAGIDPNRLTPERRSVASDILYHGSWNTDVNKNFIAALKAEKGKAEVAKTLNSSEFPTRAQRRIAEIMSEPDRTSVPQASTLETLITPTRPSIATPETGVCTPENMPAPPFATGRPVNTPLTGLPSTQTLSTPRSPVEKYLSNTTTPYSATAYADDPLKTISDPASPFSLSGATTLPDSTPTSTTQIGPSFPSTPIDNLSSIAAPVSSDEKIGQSSETTNTGNLSTTNSPLKINSGGSNLSIGESSAAGLNLQNTNASTNLSSANGTIMASSANASDLNAVASIPNKNDSISSSSSASSLSTDNAPAPDAKASDTASDAKGSSGADATSSSTSTSSSSTDAFATTDASTNDSASSTNGSSGTDSTNSDTSASSLSTDASAATDASTNDTASGTNDSSGADSTSSDSSASTSSSSDSAGSDSSESSSGSESAFDAIASTTRHRARRSLNPVDIDHAFMHDTVAPVFGRFIDAMGQFGAAPTTLHAGQLRVQTANPIPWNIASPSSL